MYLYQGGPLDKTYWFAFFKNEERVAGDDVPRYTPEQEEALAEKYANDILFNGLTFGDLWQRRVQSSLVPLEEYVLERCYHRRVVLIGDSFHKVGYSGTTCSKLNEARYIH